MTEQLASLFDENGEAPKPEAMAVPPLTRETVRPGDFLVVEGDPKSIETFMGQAALEFAGSEKHSGGVASGGLTT